MSKTIAELEAELAKAKAQQAKETIESDFVRYKADLEGKCFRNETGYARNKKAGTQKHIGIHRIVAVRLDPFDGKKVQASSEQLFIQMGPELHDLGHRPHRRSGYAVWDTVDTAFVMRLGKEISLEYFEALKAVIVGRTTSTFLEVMDAAMYPPAEQKEDWIPSIDIPHMVLDASDSIYVPDNVFKLERAFDNKAVYLMTRNSVQALEEYLRKERHTLERVIPFAQECDRNYIERKSTGLKKIAENIATWRATCPRN